MTRDRCPVSYVALRDAERRQRISEALRAEGWTVVDRPSGYHLVEDMADQLLGQESWPRPDLVVVDAISPGCAGVTIARGLRDLGWTVPVVLLVESERERRLIEEGPDDRLHVLEASEALAAVSAVARAVVQERPASRPAARMRSGTTRWPGAAMVSRRA